MDIIHNVLITVITYNFVITLYIKSCHFLYPVIFLIHLINYPSFIFSTKSPSLIFEQIFSGWFTCPTANGACQACQNILRPIPIYSFTSPRCNCAAVLAVRGRGGTLLDWIIVSSLFNSYNIVANNFFKVYGDFR